ncbi:OLC1v1021287C2 [Oldenlandia corymbosa var. corymbosa]|nr:OLC1v1021287C2 [Oldenlandia corymbosa var. corymbosa]
MRPQLAEKKFHDFFEAWMCQLEEYANLLKREISTPDHQHHCDEQGNNCKALINKMTQHHKDFYTAKWAGAHEDVLAFFNPIWLTPLETAFSWMTGWKPSTFFRVVNSLHKTGQSPPSPGPAAELTDQQLQRIESLRVRIRLEEDKVEREMERQQVSMADPKFVELTRLVGLIRSGDRPMSPDVDLMVSAALKGLLNGLETVIKMADCVRLKTLKGILDVLNPIQSLEFLAASALLLVQMRKLGKKHMENSLITNHQTEFRDDT